MLRATYGDQAQRRDEAVLAAGEQADRVERGRARLLVSMQLGTLETRTATHRLIAPNSRDRSTADAWLTRLVVREQRRATRLERRNPPRDAPAQSGLAAASSAVGVLPDDRLDSPSLKRGEAYALHKPFLGTSRGLLIGPQRRRPIYG